MELRAEEMHPNWIQTADSQMEVESQMARKSDVECQMGGNSLSSSVIVEGLSGCVLRCDPCDSPRISTKTKLVA